jgi:hypothetical protein
MAVPASPSTVRFDIAIRLSTLAARVHGHFYEPPHVHSSSIDHHVGARSRTSAEREIEDERRGERDELDRSLGALARDGGRHVSGFAVTSSRAISVCPPGPVAT